MNDPNNSNHISLATLIEYHIMGFKLVPLCEDGKTPNVSGLLSAEERQRSIDESSDGKEHQVNYILDHPEFWNKERLERERWRFRNVATLLGRIHLTGVDGRALYLNALDIDSEEVFTILCRLSTPTGKDLYFIEEACKKTFVSKTKKKYGRHVFWLSYEQHKPIGTRDCKHGCEFEIKTSFGLITLPPSRHRDDPQITYQSIGQNKIQLIERMYEELLRTLDDCIKQTKVVPNHVINERNVRKPEYDHNTEFIESTLQLIGDNLKPFYRRGYRHYIIMGLTGMLHKRNLQKEYARKIIEILTIDDEESASRFLTLEETYNKDPKEISGYNYFLSVLENTSENPSIGVSILRNILVALDGISSHGDEDTDDVVSLTHKLEEEFIFKSMRDTGEIYYYNVNRGVYVPNGKCLIEEQLEILCPEISTHKVQEVIQKIRRRTLTDRNEFDSYDSIVNVQNGLLDLQTVELKNHSPDFLSTIQLPITHNLKSKCPNILKFLSQVLHPQDIFTAMEIIGYVLLKCNKYEKAFMLFGSGDNGKSVFIKLIESFVGRENTSHVTLQDLDGDRFSSADLYGKLVNTFADLQAHKLTSTGTFKTLVSGDSIRAQYKYGQPFGLISRAKLVFSANKIPYSDDTSHAYYKRWLILAFEKTFAEGSKDTNLIHKLNTPEELSGLLNLALIALRQLEKDGGFRDIPVEEVKRDYQRKSNTVIAFLADMCRIDLASPEFVTSSGKLYDKYTEYCKQRKERPLDANIFGMELKKVGIEKERIRNNGIREYYYLGVQLLSNMRGQNQSLL